MREMKDSGITWVGNIPTTWSVHPVYYYFGERKNRNSLGRENNLLSLSYGNIIRKDINSIGGLLPESFNTYNIVERGDIIIRSTDLQNDKRSLRTGLVKEHGIITSAYIALKPIRPVNTAYFHYLLHAFDVMKVFYNMGNGVRQGLNFSEFAKLMIVEPPRGEQDNIAAYLDRKCAEIDALTADIETQIETLEQYKRSVITEAVTKGLDPDAEMKDSGVEWIGRVPIDWDVSRLKYVCSMQSGDNITSQNILEEGSYKVFGGNGMRGYYYTFNTTGECILIGRQGALAGNVHYVNEKIWATDHAVVTRAGCAILTKFLLYVLDAMNLNQYAFDTAAQPGLAVNKIMNLSIPLPSLDSQHQIASFLERRCNNINDAIDDKKNQLETLTEYKKSLIYEYVTGKKEVPVA